MDKYIPSPLKDIDFIRRHFHLRKQKAIGCASIPVPNCLAPVEDHRCEKCVLHAGTVASMQELVALKIITKGQALEITLDG